MRWFDPSHPFFLADPENNGITYFDNIEERDAAATRTIAEYLDAGLWGDGVDRIHVGVVTGCAEKVDWVKRPADEDLDDNQSGDGEYWEEGVDEKFNIKIGTTNMAKVVLDL